MKRPALSLVLCILSASAAFTQTKAPVEGVWRIAEAVTPGRNPAEKGVTITNPQPSLIIFTRGYYSAVIVEGGQPRAAVAPPKDRRNLTDAEKVARYEHWRPFVANSGTYEIKESTLVTRAIVAKNAEGMTKATPNIQDFKLEGPDTLWLIPIGDRAAIEPRLKLTRLE